MDFTPPQEVVPFKRIPKEVIALILQFLSAKDIANCFRLSRIFWVLNETEREEVACAQLPVRDMFNHHLFHLPSFRMNVVCRIIVHGPELLDDLFPIELFYEDDEDEDDEDEDYEDEGRKYCTVLDFFGMNGDLEIVRQLYNNGVVMDEMTVRVVCSNGHHHVFNFLLESGIEYNHDIALRESCVNGQESMVKQLLDLHDINIHKDRDDLLMEVCKAGQFDILLFLVEYCEKIGEPFNADVYENAFVCACGSNQLDIVKWLLRECPLMDVHLMDDQVFLWCFMDSYVELARMLYRHSVDIRVPFNMDTLEVAMDTSCQTGNVELVEWLYEIGVEVNNVFFRTACEYGHLPVAELLYSISEENGNRLDIYFDDVYSVTTDYEVMDWLEWLEDNDSPF